MDLLEKNHVDFDAQYRTYMAEQSFLRYFGYGESSECMPEIDSIQLAKCINCLKDRERGILFARVFGELDFTELGENLAWSQSRRKWRITISSASCAKEWGCGDEF